MRFKKQNMRRAVGNEAEAGVSSSSVLIVILQVTKKCVVVVLVLQLLLRSDCDTPRVKCTGRGRDGAGGDGRE